MPITITGCNLGGKTVPEIIDALNGDGPKPSAITLGGTIIAFEPLSERTKKHEHMHVVQAARYCPWVLRWLPLKGRAWAGAAKYWKAYFAEHKAKGYLANKFEEEARAAELA